MRTFRSSSLVIAGVAAGLVIGGTTVAVAAASSHKTVKVCVTKKDVVRSAGSNSTCPKKTKKKSVNVQGVAGPAGTVGPAGAAGPAGTTGAPGATGPSDAWLITAGSNPGRVSVPAGSYVVTGAVRFTPYTTGYCYITRTVGAVSTESPSFESTTEDYRGTVAVSDAFTVAAPATVQVGCSNLALGSTYTPRVSLIKIGTLH